MSADDKAPEKQRRARDVLLDMASQLLLAAIVGLIMAMLANAFVEGARWFFNTSQTESLVSIEVGGNRYNLDIFFTLAWRRCDIFGTPNAGHYPVVSPTDSIYAVQQSREPLIHGLGWADLGGLHCGQWRGSVGQYGPLVHFGATITEVLLKYVRIKIDRRVFIACGVQVRFRQASAPIAGVLFAHEALLRRFPWAPSHQLPLHP